MIPAVHEDIYARAARLWAEQGIASLRIDYRFDGDSDGAKTDGTLDTDVEDGLAALDFLARSGRVDANRMALVGWSMGGAVGAAVAGRTPYELDAVALWNPATNMGAAFPLLWGSGKIKEALHSGALPRRTGSTWRWRGQA
ncbi:alpha/beta fold hydrolase [Pseudomonas sp. B28(2017)]|uniref:alpha/beta hydrolase family protein n=1 Tax=Pseudomonas sp. B28(2017) TaxID=1981730 RepID=UPI000A1D6570